MNTVLKIYYALPNFAKAGIAGKIVNRLLAKVVKTILDNTVPSYFLKTAEKAGWGLNTDKRDRLYIVSLTSFPGRINEVWITIETILRQSFKPDKIILWLAESQFPDKKIPDSLNSLLKRGLTIEFCKEDLRSHKKYFYAFEQYPDDYIITLDDDLYYDRDLLLNLVKLRKQFPTAVSTNRAHTITFSGNKILPYRQWKHNVTNNIPSHQLVQTGGFGTIYLRTDLYRDFNNTQLIKELAFHADDLWLKMMCFLNAKKIVTNSCYNKDPITVKSSQAEKLVKINVFQNGNDKQLENVLHHYRIKDCTLKD